MPQKEIRREGKSSEGEKGGKIAIFNTKHFFTENTKNSLIAKYIFSTAITCI
jgi:hypothetical protein